MLSRGGGVATPPTFSMGCPGSFSYLGPTHRKLIINPLRSQVLLRKSQIEGGVRSTPPTFSIGCPGSFSYRGPPYRKLSLNPSPSPRFFRGGRGRETPPFPLPPSGGRGTGESGKLRIIKGSTLRSTSTDY